MTLSSVADEFLLYTTQIPKISIVLFNILKNSWKLNPIYATWSLSLLGGKYYLLFTFKPANCAHTPSTFHVCGI